MLLWLIGGITVAAIVVTVPLGPCPLNCGEPDRQLLGYTKLPGIRPAEAAKMIAWGQSFPCRLCGKRRRITILDYLLPGYPFPGQRLSSQR
jgi:hypothetical protein